MTEHNYVYVDVNYLKELEEKAKKMDYYKGVIDGINMVADRKTEPKPICELCSKNPCKKKKMISETGHWVSDCTEFDRKTERQTITAEEKAELLDALGGGEFFPKDEPKTDCEGCDRYEDGGELCDMCALEKGKEDAQTESKTTGTDCSWK